MAERNEPQDNSEQKWIPDAFDYSNVEDILDGTYHLELTEESAGVYNTSGYRTSSPISLDSIKKVKSSNIKWTSTEPTDTDIKIYTAVSDSDTVEPSKLGTHRIKITSDNTKVAASYPYAMIFDLGEHLSAAGYNDFWTTVKSDGGDIRVTESDGTELPRGVREVDTTNKKGLVYFRADDISTSADTEYYIYFGSGQDDYADDHALGMENVFSSDQEFYFTMADLTTSTVKDETSNNRNGTKTSANNPSQTLDGIVGKHQEWDYSLISFSGPSLVQADFTMSTWFKWTSDVVKSSENQPSFLSHGSGSYTSALYLDLLSDRRRIISRITNGVTLSYYASPYDDDTWHHFVMKRDGNSMVTYLDGVEVDSETDESLGTSSASGSWYMGGLSWASTHRQLEGQFQDETGALSTALTGDEILTIYNNQSSNSTFWTAGSIETTTEGYQEEVNDTSIDSISTDQDLTGKYLWVRQELSTTDTAETPRLSTLEYSVEDAAPTVTTDKDRYDPGETVNLITEITKDYNTDDLTVTLTDPDAVDRISSERPQEYRDDFISETSTGDDWDLGTDYSVNETNERLEFGYSPAYHQTALIKSTVVSDKAELSAALDFYVAEAPEHTTRIIMRYQDSNNYVAFYASHTYSVVGIEEIHEGTRHFHETSRPFSTGGWNEFRGSIDGNTAKLVFDGSELLEYELQYIMTAGRVGIMTDASETYYRFFTVGYPGSTIEDIGDMWRITMPFDIPDDKDEGGVWTMESEISGVGSDTHTFNVVGDAPIVTNLSTTPEEGEAGKDIDIECEVLHDTPTDIDETKLTLWDPTGAEVLHQVVTHETETTNSRTYKYTYSIPEELDREGTWEYKWESIDTGADQDEKSGTFEVSVPAPDVSPIEFERAGSPIKIADFGDVVKIKSTITHPENKDMTVTLKIWDPEQNEIVNETLTSETDNYEYNYTFSKNDWDRGDYEVQISADDLTYNVIRLKHIFLRWMDAEFEYRRDFYTVDQFNEPREELVGVTLNIDEENIDGNRLRIYDEEGVQVDYEEAERTTEGGTTTVKIRLLAQVGTKYTAYYNNEGSEYTPVTVEKEAMAVKEKSMIPITSDDFFTDPDESETGVHGSSTAIGTLNGARKRVIAGKAKEEVEGGFHKWHSTIVVIDDNDEKEFLERTPYGDQSGFYGVEIVDINGDGNNEIVAVGYTFETGNDYASGFIAIYSYDGTLTELNTLTWNPGTVRSEFFAMNTANITEHSGLDLIVGGMNGEGSDAASSEVRIYNVDSNNNINFIDSADTGLVEEINNNDRDRIFSLGVGDFGTGDKIVSTGTTKSGLYNEHDHWILYATIIVYDYDSGTSTLSREFQHYYYESEDLTEIFGMDIADVTGDGNDNIITGGNYYEYDNLSDIAEVRLWEYDTGTPAMTLLDRVEYPAQGHSTVLSILYRDSNNDFGHEIVGAGFFHDGEYDKGFNVILVYDGTNLNTIFQDTWDHDGRPIRDGETDAMEIYPTQLGLNEIFTTGRIGMTSPICSYYRILQVGGVNLDVDNEETDFKPLEDITYRLQTGETLDRVDITVSNTAGTEYSYYTFSRYDTYPENIYLQWVEEVTEAGVTVNYEVDVGKEGLVKILYEIIDGQRQFKEKLTADVNGKVQFSTTDHSENELELTDPVTTKEATNREIDKATLNGETEEEGDAYFHYKKPGDLDWTETPKSTETGVFSKEITGLEMGQDYDFKAMLDVGTDTYEGDVKTFNTKYGKIAGKVIDSDGNVQDAIVEITNQNKETYVASIITDANGEFEYSFDDENLANDKYHVKVRYTDTEGYKWNAPSLWDIDPTNLE